MSKAIRGPRLSLPKPDDVGRTPYVVALLVQLVLIAAVSTAVSVPLFYLVKYEIGRPPVAEHITFVNTEPVVVKPAPVAPRDTGHARGAPPPAAPPQVAPPAVVPPTPPVTPPVEIPVGISPPRAIGGGTSDTAKGVSRGSGVLPGPFDPRLLGLGGGPPADGPPRLARPSNDSTARAWVKAYWDSLALMQGGPRKSAADWTLEKNGKKYGIDPTYMYFGKYKLPTMLLALLPIYVQSNPTVGDRNRVLDAMRQDIMFQAMRAANEDDFRAAVNALRARKEAEHQAQLKAATTVVEKPPPGP